MSNRHNLKIDPGFTDLLRSNRMCCQVRLNDRDYQVHDLLELHETEHSAADMLQGKPLKYTGRITQCYVLHVLTGKQFGLYDGYAALSIVFTAIGDKQP